MKLDHLKLFPRLARCLLVMLSALTSLARADATISDRRDLNIDLGWKFLRADAAGAEKIEFADQAWATVNLPHTWNVEDGTRKNYYRGPGWYRLHLEVPDALIGKQLFLRFGAASLKAEVYVNGELIGHHEGGFAAFCVDATKQLKIGQNVVAVRVDNARDPNLSPLSGDFTIYGGLYREVRLLALSPVSITPLDDASSGVYLSSTVNDREGIVDVLAKVRNARPQSAQVVLVTKVQDADGKIVQSMETPADIPANQTSNQRVHLRLAQPHRWDGRRDPYLYHVVIDVRDGTNVLDSVEQPLGFRSYQVDLKRGFFLNEHHYDLHGVAYHQGRVSTGFAVTPAMIEQDYYTMLDLGVTAIRMVHYQHAEEEYDWADRLGLVLWTELALVNQVTTSPGFDATCEQQLTELIKQNYNHPSVCFWSMFNELWTKPAMLPEEDRLIPKLVSIAHQLDPNRLTTCALATGNEGSFAEYVDVTGLNRYFGWYGGKPSDWEKQLSTYDARYPGKKIGISEYGAGASIEQHENDPKPPKPASNWHPEEWEALVHESAWPALAQHDELWCKFVWVMFDFASAGRNEGDRTGINDKGLITADRTTRKDAFYYYQACWTEKPFVYIADRRFDSRPAVPSLLKVYSNCSSVELYIDNQLLSQKTSANHVFTWPDVELPVGDHHLRAVGSINGKTYEDEIIFSAFAVAPHPA